MKKKLFLFIIILLFPLGVHAAGTATIGGASQVEVGSSVTISVTLKNTAAWNIRINSSGSTSGCSQSFADATTNGKNATKTLSVTCKATSLGTIGFTATGDITSADGTTKNVSLNKRVTVVPVREKATDATLSSLYLEGFSLTPEFKKDVFEYTTTVPSTVNNIKLEAKANESHATLTGTGEFEVTEGLNTFEIVVTAENGATNTYKVMVNVEDTNPIEVKIGNQTYSLIKNAKSLLKPEAYEETTVTIQSIEIPAFYSETTKFTLVGVKDETGKIMLAIYEEETNSYKLYQEIKANILTLYFTDFPKNIDKYIKTSIVINDIEIPAYKKNSENRFVILYGMNIDTGEYNYYKYDTIEETFQIWDKEEVDSLEKDVKTYQYACYAFGGGLFVSFLLIICLLSKKKGKKGKNEKRKEKTNDFWTEEKQELRNKNTEEKKIQEKKSVEEAIENWEDREEKKMQEVANKSSNEELFGISDTKKEE